MSNGNLTKKPPERDTCFNSKAETMHVLANAASRYLASQGVRIDWFTMAVVLFDFFLENELLPEVYYCERCGLRLKSTGNGLNQKQCSKCIKAYGAKAGKRHKKRKTIGVHISIG